MAPVNSPVKLEKINPPMAPMKMTSIGTGEPFPISSGFSTLSEAPMATRAIAHRIADRSPFTEKRDSTQPSYRR